jgi:hypothetical protein
MALKFPCTSSEEFFELFVWAVNAANDRYPGRVVSERSGNQAWRASRTSDGRNGRVFRARIAIHQRNTREQGKSWMHVDPDQYALITSNPTYAGTAALPVANSRDYLKYCIYAAKGACHYHPTMQHLISYTSYRDDNTPVSNEIDVPYLDWAEQSDEKGRPLFVADCTIPLLPSEAIGSSWGNLNLSLLDTLKVPVQVNLFGA